MSDDSVSFEFSLVSPSSGVIEQAGTCRFRREAEDLAQERGLLLVEGQHDGRTRYWADGLIRSRPSLDLPAEMSLTAGQEWSIPVAPTGCQVFVDDVAQGGPIAAVGLVLRFDLPGRYDVRFRVPKPWIGATVSVVVT